MDGTLVVFSIQRTGSTFLKQVINSFKEFEFLGEIFNQSKTNIFKKRESIIIEYIVSQANKQKINLQEFTDQLSESDSIDLVKFAHTHPRFYFESIQDTSKSKYFGFKIFRNQLKIDEMLEFFLENRNIKKIILKRNLLDSYTSLLIAHNIKSYGSVNTSNFKVDFQENHFKKWLNNVEEFYSFLESKALESPQEYSILSYEELNCHDNNRDKFQFIIQSLKEIGFDINFDQNIEKLEQKFLFKRKQDSRANILDKFNNPDDVTKFLVNNDLEYLHKS